MQRAILTLVVESGRSWLPFSEASMNHYKRVAQIEKLPTSTVQAAIQALREGGFLWQSSRGSYALEVDNFAEWFKARKHKLSQLG